MKSIQPLSRAKVRRNGNNCCYKELPRATEDVSIQAYCRQSLISDGGSPGGMCVLLLRVPNTILFYKELLQASEMSPSWPTAGSPCHCLLSPAIYLMDSDLERIMIGGAHRIFTLGKNESKR